MLEASEELGERRAEEAIRAAEVLGVARVEFLGYGDSGMVDLPTNDAEGSFWSADVEEAARRVAAILDEEHAEVFTTYDERGGYGHPDHIQVHRVGVRAAELAHTPRRYAATVSREHFRNLAREQAAEPSDGAAVPDVDEVDIGVDDARITTVVDVSSVIDRKRAAMSSAPLSDTAKSRSSSRSPTTRSCERGVPSGSSVSTTVRRGREDWLFDEVLPAPA